MSIAFIGLGRFGKAIASLVEYNGLEYDYADVSEERLLSKPAGIVFLTVPTQHLRQAFRDNKSNIPNEAVIVNCAKGIEEGSHLMVHQIVRSLGKYPNYYALIGPSFDGGIIDQHPTLVSLGYKNPEHLPTVKKILETPYFSVKESKGYRSLELASALKNLYAILCGYANGMGYGPNTQAEIITLALQEFRKMAKAMRFADYDVMAPGVVGDVVLTCSSKESRNYQYGFNLAKDKNYQPEHTVEGFHTSHSIDAIASQYAIKLPLAELTSHVIRGKINSREAFQARLAGTY
jgi:glycerol-3-phosphate dehydrogenase (NAD(P)+)